jgi:hypothetical protein
MANIQNFYWFQGKENPNKGRHINQKLHGDPMERFVGHIDLLSNGCWQWRGSLANGGYGHYSVRRTIFYAHRFSYWLYKGDIPKGLDLDHLCRNRGCVNPDHLEIVTNKENVLRGTGSSAQYARRDRCKNGHKFDDTNTKLRGRARVCRKCSAIRCRIYKAKKKSKP